MPIFLLSMAIALAAMQTPSTPAPVTCPATPAPLPAALSGWAAPKPLAAAKTIEAASGTLLKIGEAADLALSPTPEVSYGLRPERPGGSVSHGGMATIAVETEGTYRVAIDSPAWLDVVADGKSLESVGHGHGPDCSGIRKMVDFKLTPGRYLLQIVGNGSPKLRVLVTSVPAA